MRSKPLETQKLSMMQNYVSTHEALWKSPCNSALKPTDIYVEFETQHRSAVYPPEVISSKQKIEK